MDNLSDIKSKFQALSDLQWVIGKTKEKEREPLLKEYFLLRSDILRFFGLPKCEKFYDMLVFKNPYGLLDIDEMIAMVSNVAREYLLSPVETPTKVLEDAIKNHEPGVNVLPLLGYDTHLYALFVYNEILLAGRDSITNVITALDFTKGKKIKTFLGEAALCLSPDTLEFLYNKNIPYLEEYLAFIKEKKPKVGINQ